MKIPFIGGTILLILFWMVGTMLFVMVGSALENPNARSAVIQIGMWLLPALLYAHFFYDDFWGDLKLKKFGKPANRGWLILLFLISMPMVGYLVAFNERIVFPEFLATLEQWLREKEHSAKEATMARLSDMSSIDLISAMLTMAVLPAICEEVFFRGVVLNNLIKRTSKIHLSVWLSAIIFSAVHLQFFGFFPRILMGAILGYALVLSKSLWVPIILHFLNNGALILAYFFYQKEFIPENPLETNTAIPIWLAALSLIVGVTLLRFLFNRYNEVRSNSG